MPDITMCTNEECEHRWIGYIHIPASSVITISFDGGALTVYVDTVNIPR